MGVSTTTSSTKHYYDDPNKYGLVRPDFDSYNKPILTEAQLEEIRLLSNPEYAARAGIDPNSLNRDKLFGVLSGGARQELKSGLYGVKQAQNSFTQNLGSAQNTYIDSVRKANAGAVQSGVSKGVQASQELAAMLGIQQQGVEGATALAQEEQKQYNTYGTALAEALKNAEGLAADRNMAVAELAQRLYGVDKDAAMQKYNIDQTKYNSKYTTEMGLLSDRYQQDSELYGTQWSAIANRLLSSDTTATTTSPDAPGSGANKARIGPEAVMNIKLMMSGKNSQGDSIPKLSQEAAMKYLIEGGYTKEEAMYELGIPIPGTKVDTSGTWTSRAAFDAIKGNTSTSTAPYGPPAPPNTGGSSADPTRGLDSSQLRRYNWAINHNKMSPAQAREYALKG